MPIKTQMIEYFHDDTCLEGFMAYDSNQHEPRPAVLIAHTWVGRDAFACEQAKNIAELGYIGFALDMYGKGIVGFSPEENARLMQPFLQDRTLLQTRMRHGLQAVQDLKQVDAKHIAVMGFCFGGLCALDLARSSADIQGAISLHGLLSPPNKPSKTRCQAKILVLHGHDDPLAPPDDVRALGIELTEICDDWQVHLYGHTAHAFTNPNANSPDIGLQYQDIAKRRAQQSVQNFLSELFAA